MRLIGPRSQIQEIDARGGSTSFEDRAQEAHQASARPAVIDERLNHLAGEKLIGLLNVGDLRGQILDASRTREIVLGLDDDHDLAPTLEFVATRHTSSRPTKDPTSR